MAIRLVLVDDHAAFRGYFATLLGQQPDIVVVGHAAESDSLLRLIGALNPDQAPDLLLVDVEMPGGGGTAVVRAALALHPALRVLALSMHDEPAFIFAMMAAGAHGYVLKDDSLADIVTAIREVAGGRHFFSASLGNMEVTSPHGAD